MQILLSLFLFVALNFCATLAVAQSKNAAIATLLKVEGFVETVTAKTPKGRKGKTGMLLYAGDLIRTLTNSKATVEYRDGSRIRLFQNSEIVLKSSQEQSGRRRTFKYQLSLKSGSLRGRLRKGFQRTKIRTPIALIGIKGTSIRISDNGDNATVSLTEGLAQVSNADSGATLNAGQWLPGFGQNDELGEKVAQIPNLLYLKTEEYELDFADGKTKQVMLSLQMQDSLSGKLLKRSGPVILESDYYSIRLPKRFPLDAKGFARVALEIDPPRLNDPEFEGLITIRAFIDDEKFDDVGEGVLTLKISNLGKKRTLLLDPEQGIIEEN